jgi:hypothetical protein
MKVGYGISTGSWSRARHDSYRFTWTNRYGDWLSDVVIGGYVMCINRFAAFSKYPTVRTNTVVLAPEYEEAYLATQASATGGKEIEVQCNSGTLSALVMDFLYYICSMRRLGFGEGTTISGIDL